MPPRKATGGLRSSARLSRCGDQTVNSKIAMWKPRPRAGDPRLTAPAFASQGSIDILAYPHILSLIISQSPSSTLATLLRCSKVMLRTVAPSLYQNLRVTSAKFKAMLDCAWEAPKPSTKLGPSFSTSLLMCLNSTQTLHLTAYDEDLHYPKIPRGCFTSIARVVVYIDKLAGRLTFPTMFQSLGSHLFIRLTSKFVEDIPTDWMPRVILRCLPHSFASVTLLVSSAHQLNSAPSCRLYENRHGKSLNMIVVLLPWVPTAETLEGETTLVQRWSSFQNEDGHSSTEGANVLHCFVGAELCDFEVDELDNVHAGHPVSFDRFCQWIDHAGNRAVFTFLENKHFLMRSIETHQINSARHVEELKVAIQLLSTSSEPGAAARRERLQEAQVILQRKNDTVSALVDYMYGQFKIDRADIFDLAELKLF